MTDAEGNEVGSVELTEMQNGTLLVAKLTGLPEGAHGFHVHTAGLCEPPFAAAGGHYNPTDAKHRRAAEGDPHAGDISKIHVHSLGETHMQGHNTKQNGRTAIRVRVGPYVSHSGLRGY